MIEELTTAFTLGLFSTLNPCVFPLYPGFLAYLIKIQNDRKENSKSYLYGIFILAGVLTSMVLLGGLIAALSVSIGRVLVWIIPLADLTLILLGVLLIADLHPFDRFPQFRIPTTNNPFLSAFFYGLLYGPLTFPCSGPLIVGIFAYSLSIGEAVGKVFVFLAFGLGFGLPLLLLSLVSGPLRQRLANMFARNTRIVNIVGGVILIGIGVFHFAANFEMFRIFFHLTAN